MFEDKVLDTITKYNMIIKNDRIVVAVSGGPDSMALLNALYNLKEKLNIELFVAHVNHMIRAVADSETEYVKQFCEEKKIKCFIKKVDVLKKAELEKISTEEAGRIARYDFFEEVFNQVCASKIAIAHNANDNAETIIMNIVRGAGIPGLKGIEPIRRNKYIRPIIEIERDEIEKYCKEKELNPKYDESNNENIYTRNKIRNILIPLLKNEFNPNIIQSLNRLSKLSIQENSFVDNLVLENYKKLCKKDFDIEHTKEFEDKEEKIEGLRIEEVKSEGLRREEIESEGLRREEIESEGLRREEIKNEGIEIEEIKVKELKKKMKKSIGNEENIDSKAEIILNLKEFNNLDEFVKNKIILLSICKLFGSTKGIEKRHIEDIVKLCSRNIGNKYLTPNKFLKVFVGHGEIIISKQ